MRHNEYRTEFVEHMPEESEMKESVLYIAPHFGCALHKCMCGCGHVVSTPLNDEDIKCGWDWSYKDFNVSLTPSVYSPHQVCKSHYFLTDGVVKWCL